MVKAKKKKKIKKSEVVRWRPRINAVTKLVDMLPLHRIRLALIPVGGFFEFPRMLHGILSLYDHRMGGEVIDKARRGDVKVRVYDANKRQPYEDWWSSETEVSWMPVLPDVQLTVTQPKERAKLDPKQAHNDAPVRERKTGEIRAKLFGWPVTWVIRWMGDDGWEADEARKALDKLGFHPGDNTFKCQLKHNGKRGPTPKLTAEQAQELYKAADLKD